jgi:glutathione transport system ATP-binding protein
MQGQDRPARFALPGDEVVAATHQVTMPDSVRTDLPPVLTVQGLVTRFPLRSGILGRVEAPGACGRADQLRAEGRRDAGAGRRIGLRQVDHRPLAGRLVAHAAGRVEVAGRDIAPLEGAALQALRRDIQFVFQDPYASLDPRLTVGYSVMEPLLVHS